ncbi:hypothetical protein BDV3_000718 [Batrachochytrium dendrobatidis]
MSSLEEDQAVINYYLRLKRYQHVLTYCDIKLKRRLSEPTLILWRAFSLIHIEKCAEALNELGQLQDKRDLTLAYPLAAIFAYESCKHIDHEAIQELQAKLTIASSSENITERAYILAGLLCMHTERPDMAKAYFKQASIKEGPTTIGYVYLGWLELNGNTNESAGKANSWFDKALGRNPRDVEALFGRLTFLRKMRRQISAAVDISTQLIVYHQSFLPAYIERMHMYLEMGVWDQAMEASQQVIAMSPDNIDGLCLVVLHELCQEGGARMASTYISNIFDVLGRLEPKNANMYYSIARPFARLANRNIQILDQCQKLVEKAISLKSTSEFHTELGYILFLQNQIPRARECYNTSALLDPHNISALEGIVRCQLFSGDLQGAKDQLDIFNEFHNSMDHSAEIAYLNSLFVWKQSMDVEKRIEYLKIAVRKQLQVVNSTTLSLDYYVDANPDFLFEIVKDYMEHCTAEGDKEDISMQTVLQLVKELLEVICRIVPASTESQYCLAKTKLFLGDKMGAETILTNSLKLDGSNSKVYLLMAEIHMSNGLYKPAISCLEMALSYDFEIRHLPLFHLLKAQALKLNGSYDEALTALKTAMNLPAVKDLAKHIGTKTLSQSSTSSEKIPTLYLLASLHLEVIDVYTKQKAMHDCNRAIQEALRIFSGTNQEPRITIANANVLLSNQNVENALNMLESIRSDQPYFLEAKTCMADIYLKYKNDRKNYARCYSEIVDRNPTIKSCLLLGDAYMNIQEPEQAVAVYQSALSSNPNQSILACKIGKALIKTHDYSRAIAYYESALENNPDITFSLQFDIAELFMKLKRFEDAEKLITEALAHPVDNEPGVLAMYGKLHMLLAQIFKQTAKPDQAFSSYMSAQDIYSRLISQGVAVDANEAKCLLADVCYELAEISQFNIKDSDRAISFYNEAIQHHTSHKKAAIALARLYIRKNDLTEAQRQLTTMMKNDIALDDATFMMSETMFLKGLYQQAIFHLRQLLDKNPLHFEALAQFIELSRRNASMDEIEGLLISAEHQSKKTAISPGFHYCRGLYFRYKCNMNEALQEFTVCRRDTQWGERSLHHLIEIFLNPDNETIGGSAMDNGQDLNSSKADDTRQNTDSLSMMTVEKLVNELPQSDKSLRTRVIECQLLMASKQKASIEKAIHIMMEILNIEREYIPAIYGTSVGFMLLKQPPRARNQLKRIAKMEWTIEYGDDLERCWLLLSDIYIQGGKYDLATELLKKVITHNKSSGKAYEYLGYIMEKEASYKDAAEHYHQAWKLENETSAGIGFKLAFNYLKAKRYVDAIDVCHKVLKQVPDYPKIEKEILHKARSNLRYL